jgi:hypothetical protein
MERSGSYKNAASSSPETAKLDPAFLGLNPYDPLAAAKELATASASGLLYKVG